MRLATFTFQLPVTWEQSQGWSSLKFTDSAARLTGPSRGMARRRTACPKSTFIGLVVNMLRLR